MAKSHFELHQPTSLDDALALLAEYGGNVKLLAGGTDLVPKINHGLIKAENLVSLRQVGMEDVSFSPEAGLVIGGGARLSAVAAVPEVQLHYPALAHACSVMATTQIRNMGTVAGNLANAAPSADTAAPCLVYDAVITALSGKGSREIPLAEFFTGPGANVLEPGEIITAIQLPPPAPSSGSCYLRLSGRSKVDICAVGVAAYAALDGQGKVASCRLALAAVAPTPLRCPEAEEMLTGQVPGEELLHKAAASAAKTSKPIDDMRSSAAYRRKMVEVNARRALAESLAKAKGEAA